MNALIQSNHIKAGTGEGDSVEEMVEDVAIDIEESKEEGTATAGETFEGTEAISSAGKKVSPPRKLVQDEARAVGRIGRKVWLAYVHGAGGTTYWVIFLIVLVIASLAPVAENGWIK